MHLSSGLVVRVCVAVGLAAACRPPAPTFTPYLPTDSDGDGIVDNVDACPFEPGVAPDGCPIRDFDGDGVLDPYDLCVDELEVKNGYLDEDGCRDEIPVYVTRFTGVIKGIYFDPNKDTIKPKSRPVLDRAAAVLKEFKTIRVEVGCHESRDLGSVKRADIEDLTQRRAMRVKSYLVEHGIEAVRVETRGAGWNEPVETNKTAEGRAKNRRCDFIILQPDGSPLPRGKAPSDMIRPYEGPSDINIYHYPRY